MQDAELGGEFLSALVLAPLGVVTGDALDEGDVLAGDVWSADLGGARPATPEHLEALAMPGDHGLGPDDDERAGPVGPEPAESDPEYSLARPQPNVPLRPQVDRELLAQGRILQGQGGSRHQGCPQAGE